MIHFIPRSAYVECLLGMVKKVLLTQRLSLTRVGGGEKKEVEGEWNRSVSGARWR